ncbi:MAG TPA: kinase [Erysipelotrichaceae bacterium]|nr:kinase [Erysipelotrichaceae bacterium]
MTQREQEILAIIKDDPTISQQDLADRIGITRSSVAVHITNLMKKGLILGKGYVVLDEPYVLVIGGSNIDIQGFPSQSLRLHDSNVGEVKISLGGVGRNIAENCARLGIKTRLLSAIGDDVYGQKMLSHAQSIGLIMSDTVVLAQQATSTYLSILDESRDLHVAINHMDAIEQVTVSMLKSKKSLIEHAVLVVLDTNLSQDVLDYLLSNYASTTFFVDTVSVTKAVKVKNHVTRIHTIKPNLLEADVLRDEEGKIGAYRTFISKGSQGVSVTVDDQLVDYPAIPTQVINATGAGDAFMAGLVYGYVKELTLDETVKTAMAAAMLTLSHPDTIHSELSEELLLKTVKEI